MLIISFSYNGYRRMGVSEGSLDRTWQIQ